MSFIWESRKPMTEDLKPCQECGCLTGPPGPSREMDASRGVPNGFRVMTTLCDECVRKLNAVRSDLWEWLVPAVCEDEDIDLREALESLAAAQQHDMSTELGQRQD